MHPPRVATYKPPGWPDTIADHIENKVSDIRANIAAAPVQPGWIGTRPLRDRVHIGSALATFSPVTI